MQSIYEPKSRPDNYGYWAFIGTVTMDDNSKKNIQTIILLYSYDGADRISMLGDSEEYFLMIWIFLVLGSVLIQFRGAKWTITYKLNINNLPYLFCENNQCG